MNNTLDQTKTVLAKVMWCDVSTITPASTLEALGLDSLDVTEFVLELELEFQIEIPEGEGQKLHTVQDVADLVSRLQKQTFGG